jgi:hypothetical protein
MSAPNLDGADEVSLVVLDKLLSMVLREIACFRAMKNQG